MTKRKIDDLYPELDCLMNEDMSDVVFLVEGKRVPAVKGFLLVKSRVFRAMFMGDYKDGKDKEMVIEDTTFNNFQTLIRFIYTDQLVLNDKDKNDIETLADICRLADRYEIFRLISKVSDHLKTRITDKNIDLISKIAFHHNIEELMQKTIEFFENSINGETVFKDNSYLSIIDLLDKQETIELKNRITIRLNASLSLENLNSISSFAYKYGFEELKTKVMKFIETNIIQLIKRNRNELEDLYHSTDRHLLDVLLSHHVKPTWGLYEFLYRNIGVGGKSFVIVWKLLSPQVKEKFDRFYNESMDSVSAQVFEIFIGFAYFNDFELKDWNNFELIEKVCDFCVKYEVYDLLENLRQRLYIQINLNEQWLTLKSLKPISRIAFKFKIGDLMTRVKKFIDQNFKEIIVENIEDLVEINRFTDDSLFRELIKRRN